jgi:pilus assembly protein Flp/PilA
MYLVLNYLLIGKLNQVANGALMKKLNHLILTARVWSDTNGQDLIEYALMAGFVAVSAGAIIPGVSSSISKIFSSVASAMRNSASTGAS